MTEDYSAPFGTYNGHTYIYKEVTLNGTVTRASAPTSGTYSVGMILIYPMNNPNGFGFVDWLNTIFFYRYNSICPRGMPFCDPQADGDTRRRLETMNIQFGPLTFESFLWDQGFTYASVQWDKTVTDFFGPTIPTDQRHNRLAFGTIEVPADAETILADAAHFLRDPSAFAGGPTAVNKVIAFGYSQPSCLQETFVIGGKNVEAGNKLVYDGFIMGQIGLLCWEYNSVNQAPLWTRYGELTACSGPISGGAGGQKIMVVSSQTDLEVFFGGFSRDNTHPDTYVQYELPGVAHIPTEIIDTSVWGATHPNPGDMRPFYRGALTNMVKWINTGTNPPPSTQVDNTFDNTKNPPAFITTLDADGNATGGTRLPHMPTMINGQPAGAPTGKYAAFDPGGFMPLNIFYLLAGTYDRFSDQDLMTRYPTVDDFKAKVKLSADQLLADGYITQADHDAYISGTPDLPPVPPLAVDGAPEFTGGGGCCDGAGNAPSAAALGLIVGLLGFRRRSKRHLQRTLVMFVLLVLAVLPACGGSKKTEVCVGHACPDAPINLPEGGEVRFEIAYVKDAAPEIRTAVWFASDQSPAARPWPRLPINWNRVPSADDPLCSDMRSGQIWPSGEPDSRTYLDVGDTVTLSGGGQDFVFTRAMNVEDNAYRNVSDIGYTAQIEPGTVSLGTEYTIDISGSADEPAHTIDPGVYMPPDYDMSFPDMNATVEIPLGKDFPLLWTPPAPVDDFMFAFTSFNDQIDPMVFCVGMNSGQMVIPKEFINTLPAAGSVLHGVLEHRIATSADGTRKIDLLGVNCRYGQYVITTGDL